jgi:hypothetical protein
MKPKPIFKLFSLKGKVQNVVQQGVTTLIIGSVALSLVALTGFGRIVQASGPSGQPSIEMLRQMDPADRKFFSPGYGAMSGGSEEAEVLPAIDPADRKFFTPGYGINVAREDLSAYHQSEWDRSPNKGLGVEESALTVYHQSEWGRSPNPVSGVEALSKIDPADRKFFSPGYGAQATSDDEAEAILQ